MNQRVMAVCLLAGLVALSGCAGTPEGARPDVACKQGITTAYDELSFARSQGVSGTVAWTKAASLLASAKVLEQVEKYSQCIENVDKARFYIRQSQGL